MVGSQLEHVAEVQGSLLEVAVRFQNLTELTNYSLEQRHQSYSGRLNINSYVELNGYLKMLLPCILIWWLDFKRSSCKEYGVIQVLEIEKYPGQVE